MAADEEYMRAASTATCPACGHVMELAMLVVRTDVDVTGEPIEVWTLD